MPIYTYKCQDCGADLEKRQGFEDAPLTTCERCSGRLRRTLHSVAIIFKGSGFYNTDNRRDPARSNGEASKKEDGKSDGQAAPTPKPASESAKSSDSGNASTTDAAATTKSV